MKGLGESFPPLKFTFQNLDIIYTIQYSYAIEFKFKKTIILKKCIFI